MSFGRALITLAGIAAATLLPVSGPSLAQQQDTGVAEDRAVIPRARIVRVPSAETQSTNAQTSAGSEPETGAFETRPLEPLSGSSSGGGVIPSDDQVALTDPNAIVAQPLAVAVDPVDGPRVRIVSPSTVAPADGAKTEQENPESDTEQAAVEPEDDGRPRWQRKRTRRFKQAPKGTEVLDTSRPTYAVPISPIETGLRTGARLRQLDKMTGQTITYDLENGESRRVDRLLVSLDACRSPENNASHGAMAFLKIWDTRNIGGDPNFTGWMFAESPALSALDHPRYDLWVISCTTSEAEVSTVNE